jgi:hypothetical protein
MAIGFGDEEKPHPLPEEGFGTEDDLAIDAAPPEDGFEIEVVLEDALPSPGEGFAVENEVKAAGGKEIELLPSEGFDEERET